MSTFIYPCLHLSTYIYPCLPLSLIPSVWLRDGFTFCCPGAPTIRGAREKIVHGIYAWSNIVGGLITQLAHGPTIPKPRGLQRHNTTLLIPAICHLQTNKCPPRIFPAYSPCTHTTLDSLEGPTEMTWRNRYVVLQWRDESDWFEIC